MSTISDMTGGSLREGSRTEAATTASRAEARLALGSASAGTPRAILEFASAEDADSWHLRCLRAHDLELVPFCFCRGRNANATLCLAALAAGGVSIGDFFL